MTRVIAKGTGGHDVDSPSASPVLFRLKMLGGAFTEKRLPVSQWIPGQERMDVV